MTIAPQDFTQGTTKNRDDIQNVSSEFSVTNLGLHFTKKYSQDMKEKY